ncbi:MAG: hypothetical protein K8H88_26520 [Sandaracinaceae bacterium]|nr:hypothetical protein [Sandaracinaceae bacterium]
MGARAWLLLAWVLVFAVGLFAHVVVTWQGLAQTKRERWWALLPPAAPIVAWRAGRRAWPIFWALAWITYGVLRALER